LEIRFDAAARKQVDYYLQTSEQQMSSICSVQLYKRVHWRLPVDQKQNVGWNCCAVLQKNRNNDLLNTIASLPADMSCDVDDNVDEIDAEVNVTGSRELIKNKAKYY
jgi:hypothetical protein